MLPASAADHFQEESRGSTSNMDTSVIGCPPCQLGASDLSVLSVTAFPPQNPVGPASVFKMTSTIHVKTLRPSISDTRKWQKGHLNTTESHWRKFYLHHPELHADAFKLRSTFQFGIK